jgi:hypothetical protein
MVQHAKIEEVVFSVDPTDGPKTGWIGITWYVFTVGPCPFCGYISKWQNSFTAVTSYEWVVAAEARKQEDSSKLEEYSSYELRVLVAAEAR